MRKIKIKIKIFLIDFLNGFTIVIKKSSFMWFVFSIPIIHMIFSPIILYSLYLHENCLERGFINGVSPISTVDTITFLTRFVIGSIFGLFIGLLFLKSPRGKHIIFILDPIVTIFLCLESLISLFLIPYGDKGSPPVFLIWDMINRDITRILNLCV